MTRNEKRRGWGRSRGEDGRGRDTTDYEMSPCLRPQDGMSMNSELFSVDVRVRRVSLDPKLFPSLPVSRPFYDINIVFIL